jgi:hypothetical protein
MIQNIYTEYAKNVADLNVGDIVYVAIYNYKQGKYQICQAYVKHLFLGYTIDYDCDLTDVHKKLLISKMVIEIPMDDDENTKEMLLTIDADTIRYGKFGDGKYRHIDEIDRLSTPVYDTPVAFITKDDENHRYIWKFVNSTEIHEQMGNPDLYYFDGIAVRKAEIDTFVQIDNNPNNCYWKVFKEIDAYNPYNKRRIYEVTAETLNTIDGFYNDEELCKKEHFLNVKTLDKSPMTFPLNNTKQEKNNG